MLYVFCLCLGFSLLVLPLSKLFIPFAFLAFQRDNESSGLLESRSKHFGVLLVYKKMCCFLVCMVFAPMK